MSYIDIDEYISTPSTTEDAEIIADKNLAIAWLRDVITERDAELADRDRLVNELLAELAGLA